LLAGCAPGGAAEPTTGTSASQGTDESEPAAEPVEQELAAPAGPPFSHWPDCGTFNSTQPEEALMLMGEAMGKPGLTEDEGWDLMVAVQDACSMKYDMSTSMLAALHYINDTPIPGVGWAVSDADGSWGGVSFPGRVGDYRLVGEQEYAEFAGVYPGAIVCTFLGGPLTGTSAVSDGTNITQAPYVKAVYTSSAESIAARGCDSIDSIITITSTQGENLGFLADVPSDANGMHCDIVATHLCGVVDGGATWLAADTSSVVPLEDVSAFLQGVLAG
jgi:hypothetical protein